MKEVYMKNNHCDNSLFLRAVEGLQINDKSTYKELYKKLEEVANTGKPAEFQFNYLRIRFCTKDKFYRFCLHWEVANALSGLKKTYYQKDYLGAGGGIYWRRLASAIIRA